MSAFQYFYHKKMLNIQLFVLPLQMNHQRKAKMDAIGSGLELPTNSIRLTH